MSIRIAGASRVARITSLQRSFVSLYRWNCTTLEVLMPDMDTRIQNIDMDSFASERIAILAITASSLVDSVKTPV